MPIPDVASFLLVLARIAGLLGVAPFFGHLGLPLRVRAALAVILSAALAPAVVGAPPAFDGPWALAGAVVTESVVGALVGLSAQFIFAGVQLGGQLAGIQMGFGLANLIDPGSHPQVTVVAQLQELLALLVFLALDVHHLLLRALVASFHAAPAGGAVLPGAGLSGVVGLAGDLFVVGARVAAPVLLVLLLTNAALGVLARIIPQVNVFVVGFPVNVGLGLIVLGAALPFTFRLVAARFGDLEPTLGALMEGLAHG
jgi:flagellar biosynthetic protein FliR